MSRLVPRGLTHLCGSLAAFGMGLLLLVGAVGTSASLSAVRGSPAGAAGHASPSQQAAVDGAYGKLPLAFEVNTGQTDSSVRFLAHGSGYTLYLGAQGTTLAVAGTHNTGASTKQRDAASLVSQLSAPGPHAQLGSAALQMTWVGGNAQPQITGEDQLPGVVNYFVGHDPSKWQTNVATYAQVRYHDVYPGIDLVYYGKASGQLEYDVVVQPGADASNIQLAYPGASNLTVDQQGTLQLRLANGQTIAQPAPSIYQTVNGTRQSVSGGYQLGANGQVGFSLGSYDHNLPLVIDPQYRYVTYLGGSSSDGGNAVAVDGSGNAYVTGQTSSTDFPTTGAYQPAYQGSTDVFVSKLNAAGTALVYSTYLGGTTSIDQGYGIAVDSSGNAYVTGYTESTDFPVTGGAYQPANAGGQDAFVTKLNATGTALVYSTYLGGSANDTGLDIALDAPGNAYVTGATASTNFPTHNAYQSSAGGSGDAFVTKLNTSGNSLVYSTYLGGSSSDAALGVAVDGSGNAYISGSTDSTNFPTQNAYQTSNGGGEDAFVSKLNANGNSLVYSTYLGGSDFDQGIGVAVDGSGNAYITGYTASTDFPAPASAFGGVLDAFVTKLNSGGNGLVYSTYLGGASVDLGLGIAVDSAGYAYVTGITASTDFPLANPIQGSLAGNTDLFVARFSPTADLIFSTYLGGSGGELYGLAGSIAVSRGGNVYITGETGSTDLPHPNALQPSNGGGLDALVAKLNTLPTPVDTVGLYYPANATFYLRHANAPGYADIALAFGPANVCKPVVGDWTGKGYTSVGLFCNGTFYLKNTNSPGNADIAFNYGAGSWLPIAGDWTGKGYDSIGLYDPSTSTFYLRNSNSGGPANIGFQFGPAGGGWLPIVGDWNGKGYDSVGLYNPTNHGFYLRNANAGGNASITAFFGGTGDRPVAGDWTGKGFTSIGVFDPPAAAFFLRNSNTSGFADTSFAYGTSAMLPVAGQWVAAPGSVAVHRNPAKKPSKPVTIPTLPGMPSK